MSARPMGSPMEREAYQLLTAGYVIHRAILPSSQTDALRASLDRMLSEDEATWGRSALEAIGQRGALRNLCNHGDVFTRLLTELPVYSLIDRILGRRYIVHSFDGLVLLPGQSRFPRDFHTDLDPLRGVAFPPGYCPGVNCLVYVDDSTSENGAPWLVPASHRSIETEPPADVLSSVAVQASFPSGTILTFDARLWHCAGANRSSNPRRLVKLLFCRTWIRPQMDYSRAVARSVLRDLEPRVQRLLGVGTSPPASVQELRLATTNGQTQ